MKLPQTDVLCHLRADQDDGNVAENGMMVAVGGTKDRQFAFATSRRKRGLSLMLGTAFTKYGPGQ